MQNSKKRSHYLSPDSKMREASGEMSETEIDNLIKQYRDLQVQKEQQTMLKDADLQLNEWAQKLQKHRDIADKIIFNIDARSDTFGIAEITEKQNELKEQIKEAWEDPAKKTHKSAFGTATLRTTKSLIIDSVKKVVDVLVKNDKTEECIAKFKLESLGKFAKAGLLDDAVHYDEKKSVSIKLAEAK